MCFTVSLFITWHLPFVIFLDLRYLPLGSHGTSKQSSKSTESLEASLCTHLPLQGTR